jgi:hypothetical protein
MAASTSWSIDQDVVVPLRDVDAYQGRLGRDTSNHFDAWVYLRGIEVEFIRFAAPS